MIIIKNLNKFPFLNFLKKIISKLIFIFGSISLLLTVLLFFYYFNSGMYERYKPLNTLKKIDKILINKYLGFSFFRIDDYFVNFSKSLKYVILNNDLDNLTIEIDQKNLYNLELQRKNKLEYLNEDVNKFSEGILHFDKKKYDIKLRVKGDRVLHWYNKEQTSYRIDIRGDDRIWGLEEFSVQKPITRNYIYEYIFHKFLENNKLIPLKYFFVNLSVNDTKQGIYAVEEGFSKELIERNKRRNGPIFGLEETLGLNYPDVAYDIYSENYWLTNNPELVDSALLKLEKLKNNQVGVDQIFDLDMWATYFASIDVTANFHGSIPRSVKLYYNPINAKFEPIGFDGHYNSNLFQDFLILDFLDKNNQNCSYICSEREWYLKFLNNKNFKKLYLEKLKKFSSYIYLEEFYNSNSDMINFYNDQFLSEVSREDKVLYKGLGFYVYDDNYLFQRAKYIQDRLKKLDLIMQKKKLTK